MPVHLARATQSPLMVEAGPAGSPRIEAIDGSAAFERAAFEPSDGGHGGAGR